MISRRRKMKIICGTIFLFTSVLLVNYTTVMLVLPHRVERDFSQSYETLFCGFAEKQSILDTTLTIDRNGNVIFESDRYLECLSINRSRSGVYKYMDERNFNGLTCNGTRRRFLQPGEMPLSFLTSFPGSGNTWTRYMLEEISGVYTGAIYNDSVLRRVFKAEGIVKNVIVVKTHRNMTTSGATKADKIVFLVRDPFESIRSMYNYEYTASHTGLVDEQTLSQNDFTEFAVVNIDRYTDFYVQWMTQFKKRIFIQFYTDLVKDLLNSVTKIASFLEVNVTLNKLWCLYRSPNGQFKRGPKPVWLTREYLVDAALQRKFSLAYETVLEKVMERQGVFSREFTFNAYSRRK